MDLKRILKIKEIQEKTSVRILKEIDKEIEKLQIEKRNYEKELQDFSQQISSAGDALRIIFKQKAFISKIKSIEKKVKELEKLKEKETENLKEIKREEKVVEILKDKESYENHAKNIRKEFLQLGFVHLIKKGFKLFLLISYLAYGGSAVQEKLLEMEKSKREERLKEVEKIIDIKLKKLIEERKKLEALKKKPLTEEEEREVKKLIKIVSKTPADEAGAILNEVNPRIAAEILIKLKDRQAGQILASMDPQKAAQVAEIIMEWRNKSK